MLACCWCTVKAVCGVRDRAAVQDGCNGHSAAVRGDCARAGCSAGRLYRDTAAVRAAVQHRLPGGVGEGSAGLCRGRCVKRWRKRGQR